MEANTVLNIQNPDKIIPNTDKIIPNGLSGILNCGNTCYMNSAIQAFCHNTILTSYLCHNKERICETILKNAPKIFKDNDNYDINNEKSPISIELRKKVADKEYEPNILTDEEKNVVYNSTITIQLIRLISKMWERNYIFNPISFIKIFTEARNKFFYGGDQHDAEEAYSCILQKMQEELVEDTTGKKINFEITNKSVIELMNFKHDIYIKKMHTTSQEEKNHYQKLYEDKLNEMPNEAIIIESYKEMRKYYETSFNMITVMFTGFVHSSICCPYCDKSSNKFEPFTHLSLSIPSKIGIISIYDCIKEYCAEEKLDQYNRWNCENCKIKVNAVKKMQLWMLPKFLVIQLKRFNAINSLKDNRIVEYPLHNLDVSEYVDTLNKSQEKCYSYRLICVVNHIGTLSGGHYYSYCLHNENDKWYKFDDDKTAQIDVKNIVTPSAYLLFYVRNDV